MIVVNKPSRRAQLWRLELADQIRSFLDGSLHGDALIDWAMDHPFFDDRGDLSDDDARVIGAALGGILTMGPQVPLYQRTTREQLVQAIRDLTAM
jgi:hypothetical protein